MNTIEDLQKKYSHENISFFTSGEKLPCVRLQYKANEVTLSLFGSHVISYKNSGQEILWLSSLTDYSMSRPLRGGIPICWPWFSSHPTDQSLPSHGFARLSLWNIVDVQSNKECTSITLTLPIDQFENYPTYRSLSVEYKITLSEKLHVSLTTTNNGTQSIDITDALHTYFSIDDITSSKIMGLDQVRYIDTIDNNTIKEQNGAIEFSGEVDRAFINSDDTTIIQNGLSKKVTIEKNGSNSTIIWNPWIDKSKSMSDFPNDGYEKMVCVEAANAYDNKFTLEQNQSHTTECIISVSN